jgi:phosphomevalonate kinase
VSDQAWERITLRGTPVVVAPGKLFLSGEYAVLSGAPAVLAAVSRHAVAQYVAGLEPSSPVVAGAVARTIDALGDVGAALPAGSVLVNTSSFTEDGRKLGLGSSAATAAAAVGSVLEHCGRSVAQSRDLVFSLADAAHRASQGGVGSGGDVAAAVYGGFLRYQRSEEGGVLRQPLAPCPGLVWRVFASQEAASTQDMVTRVLTFGAGHPPLYKWLIEEMTSAAHQFANAFATSRPHDAVEAARAFGDGMDELGRASGVPIVTPAVRAAAKLARDLGGAAKPSGAGGGDVSVAFFADEEAAERFTSRCPDGLSVLDVVPDSQGVSRRVAGISRMVHPTG